MGDFGIVHLDFLRDTRQHVSTLHGIVIGRVVQLRDSRTHFNLDTLCSTFTHDDVVLFAHIFFNVGSEVVTSDTDGLVVDDTTQGDNGDFGSTATDVDNHIARRFKHVDADTDGSGHRLVNQTHLFGTGLLSRVLDGTFFHLGDTRRDTDDHLQAGREDGVLEINHLDHLTHHVLCGLEVGNDAVAQGTDGFDVVVSLAVHHHGALAYCDDFLRVALHGHDGGFVYDYFVVVYDDGIGRSEVNSDFFVEEFKCSHFVEFRV